MTNVTVSRANKALVIPRTGEMTNLFPDAITLDDNRLVVPHDLRAFNILRAIGLGCSNPLLCYYDFRGGVPFSVQKITCAMLVAQPRSYVINSFGTGKTRSALWAFDYLRQEGLARKMLVVAPLSTLRFTWASEAFSTLPGITVSILHGDNKKRLKALAVDADIYVINHDGVKTIYRELCEKGFDVLVLDELAVYRNNSERSKLMRLYAEKFERVWGMTGAPMPNAPTDVWAQCRIVTPHTVPKFFKQARETLMVKSLYSQFGFQPKPDATETAFSWMQPSVRFSLDDVIELPEVVYRNVDVELTAEQAKVYKEVSKKFFSEVKAGKITAVNAAVAMGKLLQIAGGWVYGGDGVGTIALDTGPRLRALVELIESAEHKILVFVPYRHSLDGVSKFLETQKIEHAVVHGGTTGREKIFNAFQNTTKYRVLVAHPACLAHGITLTAADTIIWYGPIPSLEIYEQANARISRVGQKHRQQVLHLQGTPVEQKIYALLRNKKRVQDMLLDLFEEASAGLLEAA